jgi:hypothetical protein
MESFRFLFGLFEFLNNNYRGVNFCKLFFQCTVSLKNDVQVLFIVQIFIRWVSDKIIFRVLVKDIITPFSRGSFFYNF